MAAAWTLAVGKLRRFSCPVTFNDWKEESVEEEEVRQMSTEHPSSQVPSRSTSEDRVSLRKEMDRLQENLTTSWAGVDVMESTSDEKFASRKQVGTCWFNVQDLFVDPESRIAYVWMVLVTVAVIYNLFVIILRITFEEMRETPLAQEAFPWLDMFTDIIYALDFGVQSRTAYLENGSLVRDLRLTVWHYASKRCFLLDLLSVTPIPTLLNWIVSLRIKLPIVLTRDLFASAIFRLPRLLKYHSMNTCFEKIDSRTNIPNVLRAFKLCLHMWLVIHWTGCFYYLISLHEGLGSNDWVYPGDPEFATFQRKYVLCMYWSTMTLTTIGERPSPVTDLEYVFTGFTFLVGVFVFAYVVGNVGDVISNMNSAKHAFQARMDQLKFYMNHRQVPDPLQDRVKRWAEYTWTRTKAIDDSSVLQLLPNRLRSEMAIHVHLEALKKVRIFKQCEEGLLRELVVKLRQSIYPPGEYVCRIGEIGREMYIIDHGKVEILLPDSVTGEKKQVAIMTAGNYFGEISLLKLDEGQNKRTADVRSIGFSELLCLSRRDLMSALTEYPEARNILEAQARKRMLQTKITSSTDVTGQTTASYDHSSSSYDNSPQPSASKNRTTTSIIAELMRAEDSSKLLTSKAEQDWSEMSKVLKELKRIKDIFAGKTASQLSSHCSILEARLKEKEDELRQIRLQLKKYGLPVDSSWTTSKTSSPSTTSPGHSSGRLGKEGEGKRAFSSPSTPSPQRRSSLLRTPDSQSDCKENLGSRASSQGRLVTARSEFGLPSRVIPALRVLPPLTPSVVPRRRCVARGIQNLHLKKDQQKDDDTRNTWDETSVLRMEEKPMDMSCVESSHACKDTPAMQASADFPGDTLHSPVKEDREWASDLGNITQQHHKENYQQHHANLADSAGGDALFGSQVPSSKTLFCSSITSAVGSRSSFEILSPNFAEAPQSPSMQDKDVAATKTAQVKKIVTKPADKTSSDSCTSDTSETETTALFERRTTSFNNLPENKAKPAKPRPRFKASQDLTPSCHTPVPLGEDSTVSVREGLWKSHNTNDVSNVTAIASSNDVAAELKDARASTNSSITSSQDFREKLSQCHDSSISLEYQEAQRLVLRSQRHSSKVFSNGKKDDTPPPNAGSPQPDVLGRFSGDLRRQEELQEDSEDCAYCTSDSTLDSRVGMVAGGDMSVWSSELGCAAEKRDGVGERDKDWHHQRITAANNDASTETANNLLQRKRFADHLAEMGFSSGPEGHQQDANHDGNISSDSSRVQHCITSNLHMKIDIKQPGSISASQTNRDGKQPGSISASQTNCDGKQPGSISASQTNRDEKQLVSISASHTNRDGKQPGSISASQTNRDGKQPGSISDSQTNCDGKQPGSISTSQTNRDGKQLVSISPSQTNRDGKQLVSISPSQTNRDGKQLVSISPSQTNRDGKQPESISASQTNREGKQPGSISASQTNRDGKQSGSISASQTNRDGKQLESFSSPEEKEDKEQLKTSPSPVRSSDGRPEWTPQTRNALKTCKKIDDSELSVLLAKRREMSSVSEDKTETGSTVCTENSWKTCKKIDESQISPLLGKRREVNSAREDTNENSVIGNDAEVSRTQNENKRVNEERICSGSVTTQDVNMADNNRKQPLHRKEGFWQCQPDGECLSECTYKRFGLSTNVTSTKALYSNYGFSGLLPGKGPRIPQTRLRSPLRPLPFWKAFKTETAESTHMASATTNSVQAKNMCVGDQIALANETHVPLGGKTDETNEKYAEAQASASVYNECLNGAAEEDASAEDKMYSVSVLTQKPESCVDKAEILESPTNKDSTFNVTNISQLFRSSSKTEEQANNVSNDPVSDISSDSEHSSSEDSDDKLRKKKSRKAGRCNRVLDTEGGSLGHGTKVLGSKEHSVGAETTSNFKDFEDSPVSSSDVNNDSTLILLRRRYSAARFRRRSIDKTYEPGTISSDSSNATSPSVESYSQKFSWDNTSLKRRQRYNTRLSPLITRFEERKNITWMQTAENTETSPGQCQDVSGGAADLVPQKAPVADDSGQDGVDSLDVGGTTSFSVNAVKISDGPSQAYDVNTLQSLGSVASGKQERTPNTSPATRRRALRRKLHKRFSYPHKKESTKAASNNDFHVSSASGDESECFPTTTNTITNAECSGTEHLREEKVEGSTKDSWDISFVSQDVDSEHTQKCNKENSNDKLSRCDKRDSLKCSSVKSSSKHVLEVYSTLSKHTAPYPASPGDKHSESGTAPPTPEIPVEGVLSNLTLTSSTVSLLQSDDEIEGRPTNSRTEESSSPLDGKSGNNLSTLYSEMPSQSFQCANGDSFDESDSNSPIEDFCNSEENGTDIPSLAHQNKSSSAGGDMYAENATEDVGFEFSPQEIVECPRDTQSRLALNGWISSLSSAVLHTSSFSPCQTDIDTKSCSITPSKNSVSSSSPVLLTTQPRRSTELGQDDIFTIPLFRKSSRDKTRGAASCKPRFSMYPLTMDSSRSGGSNDGVGRMCPSYLMSHTEAGDGGWEQQARGAEENFSSNGISSEQLTVDLGRKHEVSMYGTKSQGSAEGEDKFWHASPQLEDIAGMTKVMRLHSGSVVSSVDVSTVGEELDQGQLETRRGGSDGSVTSFGSGLIHLSDFGLADEEGSDNVDFIGSGTGLESDLDDVSRPVYHH